MSFFNTLGAPQMNGMQNILQRFQQFKQTFSGNPQQQVQQLLNSGKIMQTQYIVNRVAPYPVPAYTVANPATPAA